MLRGGNKIRNVTAKDIVAPGAPTGVRRWKEQDTERVKKDGRGEEEKSVLQWKNKKRIIPGALIEGRRINHSGCQQKENGDNLKLKPAE